MRLILEIVSGGEGSFELKPGEFYRVGSSPAVANIVLEQSPDLSAVHFVIECDASGATLRDLNTRAGTLVNGKQVAFARLADGDRISVGATALAVHVEGPAAAKSAAAGPAEDSPEARRAQRLLAILRKPGEPLYAILDAARDPDLLPALAESGEDSRPLLEGEDAQELMAFAPYLVFLNQDSDLAPVLARKGWGQSWGIYFTSTAEFMDLHRHLRYFLIAEEEEGKTLFFRYYDPRILRLFLPTCTAPELNQFFGPIQRFFVENEQPESMLHFAREGHGLRRDVVALEDLQISSAGSSSSGSGPNSSP
ncbi:MAG: DUF4123 domain-containing protein [Acidobacteria bacterium]|nr:DUF4123 domain-containing protein [Acidobacteriota bacterium]